MRVITPPTFLNYLYHALYSRTSLSNYNLHIGVDICFLYLIYFLKQTPYHANHSLNFSLVFHRHLYDLFARHDNLGNHIFYIYFPKVNICILLIFDSYFSCMQTDILVYIFYFSSLNAKTDCPGTIG